MHTHPHQRAVRVEVDPVRSDPFTPTGDCLAGRVLAGVDRAKIERTVFDQAARANLTQSAELDASPKWHSEPSTAGAVGPRLLGFPFDDHAVVVDVEHPASREMCRPFRRDQVVHAGSARADRAAPYPVFDAELVERPVTPVSVVIRGRRQSELVVRAPRKVRGALGGAGHRAPLVRGRLGDQGRATDLFRQNHCRDIERGRKRLA